MKKQYFSVKTPLTIIALFIGLTEIALGLVTAFSHIHLDLQKVLVWFMVVLPILCITGFFVILFLRPQHFYTPSDFRSDDAYLATLRGKLNLKVFGSENAKDKTQHELPNSDVLRGIVGSLSDVHSWYLYKVANKPMNLENLLGTIAKEMEPIEGVLVSDERSAAFGFFLGTLSTRGLLYELDFGKDEPSLFNNPKLTVRVLPDVLKLIAEKLHPEIGGV